jgi:hypothetical protein
MGCKSLRKLFSLLRFSPDTLLGGLYADASHPMNEAAFLPRASEVRSKREEESMLQHWLVVAPQSEDRSALNKCHLIYGKKH